ncbi:NADPH:adrenodoxin oxidoreductase, mitochondrial [Tetranychus urticae]|uniref:NADPH:adrenodoxin oxidoreductase, mitochondrial n=1 Tax=Tetranychus urticae TaxID=32264 RepID=UPI00077BD1D9|nr:NADPH:adrenodoxin oxidoreductase, mitochondrial [Tetranychus urticae]
MINSFLSVRSNLFSYVPNVTLACKRYIQTIKVGIIGSGPAGFYTAQALLKDSRVLIDIYEKYPVPFGLIRFGVAPDHQSVKNVINSFTNTALQDRVSFYGNINIGQDVTLNQLLKSYNAVVLCYGATEDRKLNIEGEDLINVLPARRFVGWYNGIPQDSDLNPFLQTEDVVIIGHGNVALDCARILLSPVDETLKSTDITNHALTALRESKVKRVYLVGRRGPLQVSFTIKELRELTKLPGCDTIVFPEDFKNITAETINELPRPRKRLTELLLSLANEKNLNNNHKRCVLMFCRSPLQIVGDKHGKVSSVNLGVNRLIQQEDGVKTELTDEKEILKCGLFLRSIGYRAVSIDPSIPLNDKTGVISNTNGKVHGFDFGLYCSGWAATGATGVIIGTMNASFEIAEHILKDFGQNEPLLVEKPGATEIIPHLKSKGVKVVTFNDWQRIDELEKNLGSQLGKPREKLVNQKDMIKAVDEEKD